MKHYFLLLLIAITTSCQVTETIHVNADGSGTIEVAEHRDENSYMQLAGEEYSKETVFRDTSYVFQEYITKHSDNFIKYTKAEQDLFSEFKNVKVHIKKSAFDKDFRTTLSQSFQKIEDVPDLYKTEDYADDIENNYALTAEEHNFNVSYSFDGSHFKRIVVITDAEKLKKKWGEIDNRRKQVAHLKLVQSYALNYHFPHKIRSVSNSNAIIGEDRKSLKLEFLLADCLQNPEITNLEVVLELPF
jgi:hypothetical protein